MAKFKNIKKRSQNYIAAGQADYKLVTPLAGPIKETKKPETSVKRLPEAPRRVENKISKALRPKRIGTFTLILFVTVVLQVVLLISLLYLSPRLIH